jgi:hypothetical protein
MIYLEKFKQQLEKSNLIMPKNGDISVCNNDEIMLLEKNLGYYLPIAYKEFLQLMGKGAGEFLQGSDCFYQHLLLLQKWALELLKENNFPEKLPEDAFVFFMHQGYQFSFFRFSEGENPPTYYYCEGDNTIVFKKNHNQFSDFLLDELTIYLNMKFDYNSSKTKVKLLAS